MQAPVKVMEQSKKADILENIQEWFSSNIVENHIKNTEKAASLKEYKQNPFLLNYLAKYAFGEVTPENIAKVMIYPRVLGTSINTSFGQNIQKFISSALEGYASTTPGIDIEFVSCLDGRRKWCQLKAGPETINKDDILTIRGHFTDIRNLARVNNLANFNPDTDCVVGVLYGDRASLNAHYQNIDKYHPVFIGQEFWYQLTGDSDFYADIIKKFEECANDYEATDIVEESIKNLAAEIEESLKNLATRSEEVQNLPQN